MNEELRKEASPAATERCNLTVYSTMRPNFQIPVAYTMCAHRSSVHMTEYITRAEEECDFLWSREGEALPE